MTAFKEKLEGSLGFLRSKKLIKFYALGFLVIGLIITLVLIRYPQLLEKKAAEGDASLSFSPSNSSLAVGEEGMIEIYLYAGAESPRISGVDFTLQYEPSDLEITKIEAGDRLTESILDAPEINNAAGTARFVYANTSDDLPTGQFVIAKVFIKGKRAISQSKISFSPNYEVVKASESQDYNLIIPDIESTEGLYTFTEDSGAELYLSPGTVTVNVADTSFPLEFWFDPMGQAVQAFETKISFNKDLVQVVDSQGNSIQSVEIDSQANVVTTANSVNNDTGEINLAVGRLGADNTFSQATKIATINFQPRAVGTLDIAFNPSSTTVSLGDGSIIDSVLKWANVTIVASGAIPTPTPTLTPTVCGNGVLDNGEVCDPGLNCITGKDGQGCRNACIGGYPSSGRWMLCRDDCSGYYEADSCWDQCTSDPSQSKEGWGSGAVVIGNACPSGGVMSEDCICEEQQGMANLEFRIIFQGINSSTSPKPDKQVKVTLKQGEETTKEFENVSLAINDDGSYSGVVTDVNPDTYRVLIKSKGFLQRGFSDISLSSGENSFDWADDSLLVGDFVDDGENNNVIDIIDIGAILNQYTSLEVPVEDESQEMFDVVKDGKINILDIGLVLSNWTDLRIVGDE